MESFLALGFLVGMGHALEADHLAAVGALATSGERSPKRFALLGASWGVGHTTTLFLLSLPVILLGWAINEQLSAGLEFAVGVMLVGMGAHVLWRIRRRNVHFHVHDHGDGRPHLHAHAHAHAAADAGGESRAAHAATPHRHAHARFSPRAFLVGLVHGAAGSGALVVLAAATAHGVGAALAYILCFGVGSLFGMAALTWAVSLPMRVAERVAAHAMTAIRCGVAAFAIFTGGAILLETAPAAFGGF